MVNIKINLDDLRMKLLALFLFLLPWQTRLIFKAGASGDRVWEYGTISIYATEVLLWIIIFISIKKIFLKSSVLFRQKWFWAAIVFFTFSLISTLWSAGQDISLLFNLRLVELLLLATIFFVTVEQKSQRFLMLSFVVGVAMQAVLALLEIIWQWIPALTVLGLAEHNPMKQGISVIEIGGARFLRAYGGLPHPNILGGYLVVALVFIAPFIILGKKIWCVSTLLFIEVLMFVALLFTFSRSAYLGFIPALIIIFFVVFKFLNKVNKKLLFFNSILLIFITTLFGYIFREPLLGRIFGNNRLEAISSSERIVSIKESLSLIGQHQWFGVGAANYTINLNNMNEPVHNVVLLIISELGIVGFVGLVIFLYFIWLRIIFLLREGDIFSRIISSAVIAVAVISLFDHYPWSLYSGLMLSMVPVIFILNQANNIFKNKES